MAQNTEEQAIKFDWLKWLIIAVLFIAGVLLNNHYSQQAWSLRLVGWVLLLIVITALASFTKKGRQAWRFSRESRMELRKVVWPTRQETIQTTLVVVAMVIVLALILWGVDGVFMWAIGWLTGQRG